VGVEAVSDPVMMLDVDAIESLALGAAVLGTGGGGDPYIGKLIAQEAIAEHGPVPLIPVDALAPDDLVVIVNMSGAPTVLVEKVPSGAELDVVFGRVADFAGKRPAATLSVEIGGVNSTFPIASAARAGLPLVDGDGMGRAFPEFQMTSFNVGGVKFGPRFVTDEKGNVLRIEGIDARWIERINRRALVAMGGSVITAIGLTGQDVRRTAIRGSISLAVAIGDAIRRARSEKRDWRDLLLPVCAGIPLFEGKVVSVDRRTTEGFARGHALLAGLGEDAQWQARLDFQNEHLLARRGRDERFDEVMATTPDLLAVLDTETGTPITTEGLRYGQRATIVGIPAPPVWRTPRGLELAGPRYFGWDIDYVPVEERAVEPFSR
jgi:DUF917 family protein